MLADRSGRRSRRSRARNCSAGTCTTLAAVSSGDPEHGGAVAGLPLAAAFAPIVAAVIGTRRMVAAAMWRRRGTS